MRHVLCFCCLVVAAYAQTDCSVFNGVDGYNWTVSGTEHHVDGLHSFNNLVGGTCTYKGTVIGGNCASTCQGTVSGWLIVEKGTLDSDYESHNLGENTEVGRAGAPNGGGTQCGATAAAT